VDHENREIEIDELLARLALCIERGKVDSDSPYPPELKGQEGAPETTLRALAEGRLPTDVLRNGLIVGMNRIGERFERGEVFIPDLLISARAMMAAMDCSLPALSGLHGPIANRHFL